MYFPIEGIQGPDLNQLIQEKINSVGWVMETLHISRKMVPRPRSFAGSWDLSPYNIIQDKSVLSARGLCNIHYHLFK